MKKRMPVVLSFGVALMLNVTCLDPVLVGAGVAHADTFAAGSLIIPMDTTYQDTGMLRAYGLVYDLLRQGVPVRWAIRQGKAPRSVDFTASAKDHQTRAAIVNHGYRGGPFIIDSSDAETAVPIVDAWQAANPATVVHEVATSFDADVARYLVAAPRMAVFANGSQSIERSYLAAAGIPDSTLNPGWPDTSPDMLTLTEIAGPTTTSHNDGALFDADGIPLFCQFLSMHWTTSSTTVGSEVVAEVRRFLLNPVSFLAGCQAVPAFENNVSYGRFLTPNGFDAQTKPTSVDYYHADRTFAQLDGGFSAVGGSYPAFALPSGDSYKAAGVTMITGRSYPEGEWDVWMTGYLDGACTPGSEICGSYGKVSYLGGHQYAVNLPISSNPETQGARLFLNSLFDSTCATAAGQPQITFTLSAPSETDDQTVQYTISYANAGPSAALNAKITGALPSGAAFVSATNGGILSGENVTWSVGNLSPGESDTVSFIVQLGAEGTYTNIAQIAYSVGVTPFTRSSNTTSTIFIMPRTSIAATIKFEPQTLNKKSHGKWVSVEIKLPKGYKASDIDISSIRLEGTVHAEAKPYPRKDLDDGASKLTVKFKRSDVIAVLPAGKNVPVHVTGNVGTTAFEGTDIIKVIH